MDILLFAEGENADISLRGNDLVGDDSLYTAVLLSLFTDARADATDELPAELGAAPDMRGYWGDTLEGLSIGSKLWLLRREKQLAAVLHRAELYAQQALAWLIQAGYASTVRVNASIPAAGILALAVSISRQLFFGATPSTAQWNFTFSLEAAA
jgi:phage gp46-like protein